MRERERQRGTGASNEFISRRLPCGYVLQHGLAGWFYWCQKWDPWILEAGGGGEHFRRELSGDGGLKLS